MLNSIIRFSLLHRLLIVAGALALFVYGCFVSYRLPIDVFPDLNRPRVVVMIEAPGLAPEEVESLVNFPIETSLNGAVGVEAVHSESSAGLGIVRVEFAWGTDTFTDRQVVAERLSSIADQLPPGVSPQIAPVSSVMGQIVILGLYVDPELAHAKNATTQMELRTLADWTVRQRLQTISGVSQVFVVGGELKQYQVLVSPDALNRNNVTIEEVRAALAESNRDAAGGYLDKQGQYELAVRVIGRIRAANDAVAIKELEAIVVKTQGNRSVLLREIATVTVGEQTKRGDARVAVREADGSFTSAPAVLLTITKQPGADTATVTNNVTAAVMNLQKSFPQDIRISTDLYQQKGFIDRAVTNVMEAVRDGGILVVIILVLFLVNVRTTFITLTAIPLSIAVTGVVFYLFGMSLNTMTLGGIAVAIGELVDDAIVDVENIFRRLKENRNSPNPKPVVRVVYDASSEIRNSIVFGTIIVVLVFIPVFALSGMEGKLFAPLGIAYIVSIIASLVVSLTLTPVLSFLLLGKISNKRKCWFLWQKNKTTSNDSVDKSVENKQERDGFLLRILKPVAGFFIRLSMRYANTVLVAAGIAVVIAAFAIAQLERDFLPPFDEGSIQINAILPAGTSLAMTTKTVANIQRQLEKIDAILSMTIKTGRAELDEHAAPVNATEIIANIDPKSPKSRSEIIAEIRDAIAPDKIPGIVTSVEQPMAHLISAMLSGVQAQVAIKIFGDDLSTLRRIAEQIKAEITDVRGVVDLQIESQYNVPQLRIETVGDNLARYGLRREAVIDMVETAMNGSNVSQIVQGQSRFPLVVRLDQRYREDLDTVRRLRLDLPNGGQTTLESVAKIGQSSGPSTIKREQARRRIAVTCNTAERGVVDVVNDIQKRIAPVVAALPSGYFVEYGGQFESQQSASRTIALLFAASVVGMLLILHIMFRSVVLSLQVMVTLPTAFIGAVAALYLTHQTLSIAAMVGFISLCGIAARNGILLLNHYLHLVRSEGEEWTMQMIVRAGKERLAPVLMTALASGIALVPLSLAAGEPGKEILYPVATVIIGGLITSTIAEFFVRPALFWKFGINAARKVVEENESRELE
ncbi:MAG: CusA/CzcA family heavy metal efflux RND transporter [Planctomycetaceae bacterium]|jgi:HME family heavy-metal exporter|nr:CusA/CzcA family heavy metal efflux RND transporter [Planctomycetaceae bacterium]